jgi:hypothetical protein
VELRIHLAVEAGHTLLHSWWAGEEEELRTAGAVGQEAALLEHQVAKQPESR